MSLKTLLILFTLNALYDLKEIYSLIDRFDHQSLNIYYSSVVQGTAFFHIKLANSSLALSYQFSSNENNDFIEILRNYGSKTQIFKCSSPLAMSIDIKTNFLNKDIFKFMLYVENELEKSDIYAFTFNLSYVYPKKWFTLRMPFDEFKIFYTTSSNPVLDLSKIRAWRIAVFNSIINASKLIEFRELKFICNAFEQTKPSSLLVSSAFIQIWNTGGCSCGDWSETKWYEEILKMNSVGINRLIVQYTVYHNHSWLSRDWTGKSTIDRIFSAVDMVQDFQVILGLYFDEEWNKFNKYEETYYNFLLRKQKEVIDQIANFYGDKISLWGIYVPQEWNNVEWKDDFSLDLFTNWTKKLTNYIKLKSNFKILLSPFFRSHISLENTKILYEKFLNSIKTSELSSSIDEICIQDSIGVDKSYANNFISLYNNLEVLKQVIEKKCIKFGVNIEIFEQTGTQFLPANIKRIQEQLAISKLFTQNLFAFDWSYMMVQNYTLLEQYKKLQVN